MSLEGPNKKIQPGGLKKLQETKEDTGNKTLKHLDLFLRGVMAATVVGAAAAIGTMSRNVWTEEGRNKIRAENLEHKKQGEALIIDKDHKDYFNQVLSAGKVPVVIPHPEEWIITFGIGHKRGEYHVEKEEYEKYKTGDKIIVRYDDRGDMYGTIQIEKILGIVNTDTTQPLSGK